MENSFDGSAYGRGGCYRQRAGFARSPRTILQSGERHHEEIVYRYLTEWSGG